MVKHDELINQKLQDHIRLHVEYFSDNISTPQTYFFLSMLLVQSVGFIEQKVSSIVWEIGYRECLERYNIFKEYGVGSIEYNKLNKLYKKLKQEDNNLELKIEPKLLAKIKELIKASPSLFEELEYNFFVLESEISEKLSKYLQVLINDIKKQQENISEESDKEYLQNLINDIKKQQKNIFEELGTYLKYLQSLIDSMKKQQKNTAEQSDKYLQQLIKNIGQQQKNISNELNNYLQNLIRDLKEQRNFIAHFKSFYPDKSIVSFCAKNENNKNIRFEDFLLYFAVLIELDEAFIEDFEAYEYEQ